MLPVESVVLVLVIIWPATFALLVMVTPFIAVFLIVVPATAGRCGRHRRGETSRRERRNSDWGQSSGCLPAKRGS
jgi:uncharacterized membrane protein